MENASGRRTPRRNTKWRIMDNWPGGNYCVLFRKPTLVLLTQSSAHYVLLTNEMMGAISQNLPDLKLIPIRTPKTG
jgi:hypothetical protein